jgi:hypothetical protein
MSQITQLASGAITAVDTITIELVKGDEPPRLSSFAGPSNPPSCIPADSPTRRPPSHNSSRGRMSC